MLGQRAVYDAGLSGGRLLVWASWEGNAGFSEAPSLPPVDFLPERLSTVSQL